MYKSIILLITIALVTSTIEKGYTIISPREYRNQYFGANDNTTHVIIGNYLDQKGNIDAIRVSENSYQFNINLNEALRGKTKYYKAFGSAENYNTILLVNAQSIASGIQRNNAMKGSNIIIDWDHKLLDIENQDQQQKAIQWLKNLLTAVPKSILKIPAHFLCKTIKQIPFHKHLNHGSYIIQLYGSNNPYLTYESIFTNNAYQNESNGYSSECPKNPSITKLKAILQKATFNIQKSLNTQNKGYVGEMSEWILKAGTQNVFSGVVFFDQHPMNMIKL